MVHTLSRKGGGGKTTEVVEVVGEVEEEGDNQKASTLKQMQDIVLQVQVGQVFETIKKVFFNQGNYWMDSKSTGKYPECVQLQLDSLSYSGRICYHCTGDHCSLFHTYQVCIFSELISNFFKHYLKAHNQCAYRLKGSFLQDNFSSMGCEQDDEKAVPTLGNIKQ